MRQNVPKFAAFVNRSGSLGCTVAADSAGERELFKKFAEPFRIRALFGINL
jgi:hypothetical protein